MTLKDDDDWISREYWRGVRRRTSRSGRPAKKITATIPRYLHADLEKHCKARRYTHSVFVSAALDHFFLHLDGDFAWTNRHDWPVIKAGILLQDARKTAREAKELGKRAHNKALKAVEAAKSVLADARRMLRSDDAAVRRIEAREKKAK